MIKNCIKFYLMCATLLVVFNNSSAANLVDIRTGYHQTYSRLVLQFDVPVRYQVFENQDNPAIIIDVSTDGQILEFEEVNIDPVDPLLQRVTYNREEHLLTVAAYLKNSHFSITQYPLYYPFRIVIDIYSSQNQLQSAVAMKTDATKNIKLPEKSELETSEEIITETDTAKADTLTGYTEVNVPEEVLKETSIIKDLLPAPIKIPLVAEAKNGVTMKKQKEAKKRLFWLLGTAFLLLDVVLLAGFVAYRSKNKPKTKAKVVPVKFHKTKQKQRKSKQPAGPVISQPKEAAQTKANDEFLMMLKNAVERDKAEIKHDLSLKVQDHAARELEVISKAVKLDNLIGTLSNAVNEQKRAKPVPPDFKEIVRELDLVAEDISEEDAKTQLIGKDGVEFMRNIKRLYLN